MKVTTSLLFGMLALVLLILVGCTKPASEEMPTPTPRPAPDPVTRVNTDPQQAPDFTAKDLEGNDFTLSDHRGKVILVNFWATWCPPCIAEMPDLISLHDELSEHGFMVVGISEDIEGAEVVLPFAEQMNITYPILVDDGSVAEKFGGIFGLPVSYIINAEGEIMHRFLGLFPTEEMRPQLISLLENRGI